MRKTLGLMMALAVLGTVYALDGTNGYSAAEVFRWGDVRGTIFFDAAFSGVEWADMTTSHLGGGQGDGPGQMDLDAAGDLFFLVTGWDGTDNYHGLIHSDGTNFTNLMQESWVGTTAGLTGAQLWQVRIAPVTDGRLVAGHPVVLRFQLPDGPTELVSVDPTVSPPTETIVHAFTDIRPRNSVFDIAADGTIYVLRPPDGTIERLSYNAATATYDVSVVPTSLAAWPDILVGPDGALYTFDVNDPWYFNDTKPIYRVDPDTGATSVYGTVQSGHEVHDWAWDSDGNLWVGLTKAKGKKHAYYVAGVPAGGSAGGATAISSSANGPAGVSGGPDGTLFVREYVLVNGDLDAIHKLTPSGDGGGNGGGNGGGKGKPKK